MRFQSRSMFFGVVLGLFAVLIIGGILAIVASFAPLQQAGTSEPSVSIVTPSMMSVVVTVAASIAASTPQISVNETATATATPWLTGIAETSIATFVTSDTRLNPPTIPPGIGNLGGGRIHYR